MYVCVYTGRSGQCLMTNLCMLVLFGFMLKQKPTKNQLEYEMYIHRAHFRKGALRFHYCYCTLSNPRNLDKAVKGLHTSGCTALGPALSICAGFLSKVPSSEIVLCTDGMPNVGVGSLQGSRQQAGFYRTVSSYLCLSPFVSVCPFRSVSASVGPSFPLSSSGSDPMWLTGG